MGMHIEYNYLPAVSLDSGWVDTLNSQYVFSAGFNPLEEETVFSFVPALDVVYGDSLEFIIPSELFFTNIDNPSDALWIKFGDGEWQEAEFNTAISHHLGPDPMAPVLPIRVRRQYFGFDLISLSRSTPLAKASYDAEIPETVLIADLSIVGGNKAIGYAAITFGKDGQGVKNTCFKKPLIFVEGIDFGTRENPFGCRFGKCGTLGYVDIVNGNHPDFPQLADGPHLVEALTNAGYDIIYLDFWDGATYIENNAMLLVKLIQHINQYKCTNEEIVVCGASMGGLIAKYALSYMETNEMNHCTRTYVSFDAPHKGANIPLGLQGFIRFAKDELDNANAIHNWNNQLTRAATKQLLIYHRASPSWLEPHDLRPQFLANLAAVGNYPEKTRNVAVINSSPLAKNQGYSSGAHLLEWNWHWGYKLNIDLDLYATCGDPSGWLMKADFRVIKKNVAYKEGAAPCTPIDHAPGSMRHDIKDQLGVPQKDWVFGIRINLGTPIAHYVNQCFIPSISALDVNTTDYFFNIENALPNKDVPNPAIYPFDAFYAPDVNQDHVEIKYNTSDPTNPQLSNIAWLVNELETSRTNLGPGSFTGTYNFGEAKITHLPGLYIDNGGIIQVNGDYATASGSGLVPAPGSDFVVHKSDCDEIVKIKSGGKLILGDDNAANNTGQLIFGQGKVLEIESNGQLLIHDGSRLVIEGGAQLIFHAGAQILLEGPDAVLEIRGTLKIMNTTFTFSQSSGITGGFVRFDLSAPGSGIQPSGSACKVALTGSSVPNLFTDKVLEIINGTLTTPDISLSGSNYLDEFNISHGQVTLGAGSALEVSVNSNFERCHFTGLVKDNNTGLRLPNAALASITRCYFQNLANGLYMDLTSSVSNPSLNTVSFQNNNIGLSTYLGGLDIFDASFSNNSEAGWWLSEPTRSCKIYRSSFTSNGFHGGIWAENSTQTHLFVEECSFGNNDFGIRALGDMQITAQCSRFNHNTISGMYIEGLLNISSLHIIDGESGGNSSFYNNENAVEIYGELYMDEGGNTFVNNSTWSTKTFFTGILPNCNPCGFMNSSYQVYASDNYWDPGYQSSLSVATSPNPTPASFTGSQHASFTSSCFTEGTEGFPEFSDLWPDPWVGKTGALSAGDSKKDKTESGVILIPNPADKEVKILNKHFSSGEQVQILVYDSRGRKVLSLSVPATDEMSMNISQLPPGIYTVNMHSKAKHATERLNIIH